MTEKIWVKAATPHSQFAQDVVDAETGQLVSEHVRAATIDGRQVPIPTLMTKSRDVDRALTGDTMSRAQPENPGLHRGAQLELCTDDEVAAYLAGIMPEPQDHPEFAPR